MVYGDSDENRPDKEEGVGSLKEPDRAWAWRLSKLARYKITEAN